MQLGSDGASAIALAGLLVIGLRHEIDKFFHERL